MAREMKIRMWNGVSKKYHYDVENVLQCLAQQNVNDGVMPTRGFTLGYDHIGEGSVFEELIANNGKQDFYIGDIVVNPQSRKHIVVIWDNLPCLHYVEKGRDYYQPMTSGFLYNKKVVGNIHESEVPNE